MKVLNILLWLSLMAGHLCIVHSSPSIPQPRPKQWSPQQQSHPKPRPRSLFKPRTTSHPTYKPMIWCSDYKWRHYDSESLVALVNEPKSWQGARRYCEGLGGHLANLKVHWLVLSLEDMPGYYPSKDYWFGQIEWPGHKSYSNWERSATMLKWKPLLCKSVKVTSGEHHLVDTKCLSKRPFVCQGKRPCENRPAFGINHGLTEENTTIHLHKHSTPKIAVECVQLGSTYYLTYLRLSCDRSFDWKMSPLYAHTAIITVNDRMQGKRCRCYLHHKYLDTQKSWLQFDVNLRIGAVKKKEEISFLKVLILMGLLVGAGVLLSAGAVILAIRRKRDAGRTAQDGSVPSVPTADA